MEALDNPSLDGFSAIGVYRSLGVDYLILNGASGVQLDLSREGVMAVEESPQIASLLERMGVFIAENGGYSDKDKIKAAEPGSILAVGESRAETRQHGYRNFHLASVYRHDSAPEAIVKAYDYDRISSLFQFYLGAWMHDGFARADDGLSSPRQLAMFTAASGRGHRTAVMNYQPGSSLKSLIHPMDRDYGHEATNAMLRSVDTTIEEKVSKILGWRGSWAINDLRNLGNIILDGSEPLAPEEVVDQELTIIDQPVVRITNLPK